VEKEVIGKMFRIHAPDIPLPDGKGFRAFGGFNHKSTQLGIELVRELWSGQPFVPIHDAIDV